MNLWLSTVREVHHGGVLSAEDLAQALPTSVVAVTHVGGRQAVAGLEFVDEEIETTLHTGDLLLAAGPVPDLATRIGDLLGAEGSPRAAGLVVRRRAVSAELIAGCEALELTLLTLADGASWSVVLGLIQTAIDLDRRSGDAEVGGFDDLFTMAEHISQLIDAPVTIEDAHSRVLAYSSRQDATDETRVSTIIGRRVPREVRDRLRAQGVFRRLATSDEPVFVGKGAPGVRPRYVVPVRVGSEWLGSIWAVVDHPVPIERLPELRAAADVVALHILRMRAHTELSRQLSVEQVRSALRGSSTDAPLPPGPWRVVALAGPGIDESPETRRELWIALARRHGWATPLVADLGDDLLAVVAADGNTAGCWTWWAELVRGNARRDPSTYASAGQAVEVVGELPLSRTQAVEQLALGDATRPATTAEESWAAVTRSRARRAVSDLKSPLGKLLDHDVQHGTRLAETLAVVLDHWAEPRNSAQALGVHANTVRYRMEQIRTLLGEYVDPADPAHRLALRLHLL